METSQGMGSIKESMVVCQAWDVYPTEYKLNGCYLHTHLFLHMSAMVSRLVPTNKPSTIPMMIANTIQPITGENKCLRFSSCINRLNI